MKSSSVLPIAAGILGVGAFIYIYLRQRDKDKKKKPSQDTIDNSSDTAAAAAVETLEFKVENSQVPIIVGRNSVNLKSIEEKTKTVIRFRDGNGDHQMCSIKGKPNHVKNAKLMIDLEKTKPSVITDELLVPTSSCGKIEGYCGSVLHEICQKSSAKVWVDPGTRKSQGENRRVLITGTKEQVELAKKLIEEKMKEPLAPEMPQNEEKKDEFKRSPRASLSPYGSSSSITATETPREIMLPSPERIRKNDGRMEVFVSACATPSRYFFGSIQSETESTPNFFFLAFGCNFVDRKIPNLIFSLTQ
jgi:tudor domain-containing protein 2